VTRVAFILVALAIGAGACETPRFAADCFGESYDPPECRDAPATLREPLPEAPPGCILLDPLEGEAFYCPPAPEPVSFAS
jgi:hypothetical protein